MTAYPRVGGRDYRLHVLADDVAVSAPEAHEVSTNANMPGAVPTDPGHTWILSPVPRHQTQENPR
ncbi:hypothetical protein GCM10022252_68420 [Streptosporangium oxazolinicum]|uniref:Uncharacterized protein n=1 Tax=Streptosporangium oxazolinicum TaxID=909287 RepID=A0ABP8BGM4_9ACTN